MRFALAIALGVMAAQAGADTIVAATYSDPTTRYPHGVLGDDIEYGTLRVTVEARIGNDQSLLNAYKSFTYELTNPDFLVWEDTEPRLWDVTGDGEPEVVVVQSHKDRGARLVVLGLVDGKPALIADTPFIGTPNRWLAPVAAVDLESDGVIEIAYVDRPHLAKVLRIWRFEDGDFYEAAQIEGLSNHLIGDDFIQGGARDCGDGPQLITANANWTYIMATQVRDDMIESFDIADYTGPESITAALACQ